MNWNQRVFDDQQKSLWIKLLQWCLLASLLISAYEIGMHCAEPKLLPIRHIQINGKYERINLPSINKGVKPYVKGFFSTDVIALKDIILKEPFVDEVVIKRLWPDTLLITLTEITLVASWGENASVTSKGLIIPVKVNPTTHLPNFVGPESQINNILMQYVNLSNILHPFHLSISEINLNPRHSWQITLDNGINLLLGRKDIAEHLSSFALIYPKLKKMHGNRLASIDLRHSNGLSVNLVSNPDE